jgi:UDP-GlcNAc3NAcA epimerase
MVLVYGAQFPLAGLLPPETGYRVAHVDRARSFNMKMPGDQCIIPTDLEPLFCPTDNAVRNLQKEGFGEFNCEISQVGDVMFDAALFYGAMSSQRSTIIKRLNLSDGSFVLSTVHRQENTDTIDNLKAIVTALNEINRESPVVLPLHPRTRKILDQYKIKTGFETIEPVGYFEIVELLKHCKMLVTDSGGRGSFLGSFASPCVIRQNGWNSSIMDSTGFAGQIKMPYCQPIGISAISLFREKCPCMAMVMPHR